MPGRAAADFQLKVNVKVGQADAGKNVLTAFEFCCRRFHELEPGRNIGKQIIKFYLGALAQDG